jgi:uncharacterized protein (DUF2384 family)
MTTVAFDLRHPELIAHELAEANRRLAREDEVPPSILELVRELSEQIADTGTSELEAIDPFLWIELQSAALKALGAIQEGDPREERRAIRIGLEQLRFLLTRLAERQAVSEDRPAKELVRWLDHIIPVPQRRKAELLGVADRTYQRWVSAGDSTEPEAADERSIRLLARIAGQLRHSLGGAGVIDWLEHPRDELDGDRPIDMLQDPAGTDAVLRLAVATRSSTAA